MIDNAAFELFELSGLTGKCSSERADAVEDWLLDCGMMPDEVAREVQGLVGAIGLPTDQMTADLLASLAAIA